MSIVDPLCADIERWELRAGHAWCPDCSRSVSDLAISAHVEWHLELRRVFFGGEAPSDLVVERSSASSRLVRLVHELQVARLG